MKLEMRSVDDPMMEEQIYERISLYHSRRVASTFREDIVLDGICFDNVGSLKVVSAFGKFDGEPWCITWTGHKWDYPFYNVMNAVELVHFPDVRGVTD